MSCSAARLFVLGALVLSAPGPGQIALAQSNACGSATPLTLGGAPVEGDTFGATNDGTSTCDASGSDVWYSVTLPDNPGYVLRIDLCVDGPAPSLALYSACGAAALTCSNSTSFCSLCSGGIVRRVVPDLAAGTYRIRISDHNGGLFFTIRAQFLADPEECVTAPVIACPSTTSGTTQCAGLDSPPSNCGEPVTGPGVWYRMVGTGGTVTADAFTSSYDTKLHVFTGSCGSLTCVTANDDGGGGTDGLGAKVAFHTVNGQDYFILVSGFGTQAGTFTLNVTCAPTATNDECAAAQVIGPASGSTAGTTVGATAAGILPSCAPSSYPLFDVWYTYTPSTSGPLTVDTCGGYDTLVSIHTACPTQTVGNQLTPTASTCNNNGRAGCTPGSRLSFNVVAATTYLIRVAGAQAAAAGGNFTLTWKLPCPGDVGGNGSVNVTDLLELIGDWGPCAPPCPSDINGDGTVNVTDLLALISVWGPCP